MLGAFETVEGKPPTMADIRSLVGDALSPLADDPSVVRVVDDKPKSVDDEVEIAQQQEPAKSENGRGIAPNVEPVPGSPEFQAAMTKAIGYVVRLPDG